MAGSILVGALGPKNRNDADETKLGHLGRPCAEFSICSYHATVVYRLPFDFAYAIL